ncbi:MAG: hypothetical protein IJD49_04090 [Clostridia bacterium]|nr:hypothetical protein [Clostridia bacterium]
MANSNQTAGKNGFLAKLWVFVKFIIVSLGACIVQIALVNLIPMIPAVKELFSQEFVKLVVNGVPVFNYPVNYDAAGNIILGGLGYCIAFNVSNVVAQIVAFFINREKTFKSSANIAVTLPIYFVCTIIILLFSAWLAPTLYNIFLGWNWSVSLSNMLSTFASMTFQFIAFFPVQAILFRKKKEDK